MKKYFVFLLISAFLISCSKDDDTPEIDPIVGTFRISTVFGDGQEYDIDACADRTTIIFEEDRKGYNDIYAQNTTNSCGITETGILTWRKGDNIYTVNSSIGLVFGSFSTTNNGTATIKDGTLSLIVFDDGISWELRYRKQ